MSLYLLWIWVSIVYTLSVKRVDKNIFRISIHVRIPDYFPSIVQKKGTCLSDLIDQIPIME